MGHGEAGPNNCAQPLCPWLPIISNDLTFAADAEAAGVEIVGESMPLPAIDEATIRILGCRLNDKCGSEAFQGMSVSFKRGVSKVGWWKLPKTPSHKTECECNG